MKDDGAKKPKRLRPFLRWAGGKQWLSSQLVNLIPPNIGTYYEPFLGGASLYFQALPNSAVLADVNPRLVETYQALRDEPLEVIAGLRNWVNDKETYYRVRDISFSDIPHRAAQFIYLNRVCWNGLYRVNQQGKFNVPFGNHGRAVADEGHLVEVSQALQEALVSCGDFEDTVAHAEEGDFIYFDPPYTSLDSKTGFRQYNETLFSWEDQRRLGRIATSLSERGCHVVVSNANHDGILELYPGFSHRRVTRHSILAANPEFRRLTTELLIASGANPFQAMDC